MVYYSTPSVPLSTIALYCQPQRNLYNGPYSKARLGWTWRLPIENGSTQLKLFSYPQRLTVNFFSTGNTKMQTNVQKHTENLSIIRKFHSNALGLLRRQRLRLVSYRYLASPNALLLQSSTIYCKSTISQNFLLFTITFSVYPPLT